MLALPSRKSIRSCEDSVNVLCGSAGILPALAGILPASTERLRHLSLAHQYIKCLFEGFSESHNAAFVSCHDENLAALHVACLEQAHDFVRHFRRAVSNGLRTCRNAIQN